MGSGPRRRRRCRRLPFIVVLHISHTSAAQVATSPCTCTRTLQDQAPPLSAAQRRERDGARQQLDRGGGGGGVCDGGGGGGGGRGQPARRNWLPAVGGPGLFPDTPPYFASLWEQVT
ncbi:hypothetical protein ARSEF4850_009917, partial [Beauveria asiatica]